MRNRRVSQLSLSILGLVGALLAWQLATWVGMAHPLYLPSPLNTARAAVVLITDRMYWSDVLVTMRRAAIGFCIAALLGIPAGLLLGVFERAYYLVSGSIDFLRSIPTAALLPLFIVVFGLGDESKIAVVFFGCVFIFLINALYGARGGQESVARKNAIRTMGGSATQEFFLVVVPESLLSVATSLRLAASLALVLAVFTEMFLGADDGVGRRLLDAYLSFSIPTMYAYIVTLGLVGVLVNKAFELIEAKYISVRR